jgi:uncharacterized OB-fold protein
VPYVVAVVETDDGLRRTTNVVGCAPDHVKIGMKVRMTFRQAAAAVALPVFEPI